MNPMSYSNIVTQSQNKNTRRYHTTPPMFRCNQNHNSYPIRPSSSSSQSIRPTPNNYRCNTNGATGTNKNSSKPRYSMWGNSVCSIRPKNGTHSTAMQHTHLLGLYQRLHAKVQQIEPKLAHVIAPIIIKNMNGNEINKLLQSTSLLRSCITKEMESLPKSNSVQRRVIDPRMKNMRLMRTKSSLRPNAWNHSQKSPSSVNRNGHSKSYKSVWGSHEKQEQRQKSYKSIWKSHESTKKRAVSKLNVVHHQRTQEMNKKLCEQKESSVKHIRSLNKDKKAMMNRSYSSLMEVDEKEYVGLPPICAVQVLRVVVNIVIPKQIFELLLERLCINRGKCTKKIFVRCHKSHFHENSTVIYIHFINFDEDEYRFVRDTYFDFVDGNRKRIGWFRGRLNHNKKQTKHKKNIFDVMGNELDLIKVHGVKEYNRFKENIHNLSRIVNICLRCKINKASSRKRVCSFCINDERDDRTKIINYYRNPYNDAVHKTTEQIQKDLIRLKIDLCLIPLAFRSDCNKIDVETNKCNLTKCGWVHNNEDRLFGKQLSEIRSNAIKQQYGGNGEYELNNYDAIRLQLKYRNIIGRYYNVCWRNNEHNISFDPLLSMEIIKKHLIDKDIKLYLIPTVYKNWCYYAKDTPNDRICSKRVCTFVHDDDEKMFGDLLWKIKYDAVQARWVQERESNDGSEPDVNLTDVDDDASVASYEIKTNDPNDKWWRQTITPYLEANFEEHEAEKHLVETWRIDGANICVTSQQINAKNTYHLQQLPEYINYNKLSSHSLFVEFDDDKSAKIRTMQTYVRFVFKCNYSIDFNVIDYEENMRTQLEQCDLVKQFMNDCVSMADWLRVTHRNVYKHFRSHIHIGAIIASFAVTPDKNCPNCVACYFNQCNGIKHRLLYDDEVQLQRNCCDNDLEKEREHKFDTRKCDSLYGLIVSMERRDTLKMEQDGKTRYKALIIANRTNAETYLKFLTIGSNKYNTNNKYRCFTDVLVDYPCNTHQYRKIKEKLELLEQYSIHREHEITQIIFGFNGKKPRNIYRKQRMDKKQISELFGGSHALNKSQINAVHGAMHHNLYTIQGPPATGKTDTCSHIAYLWWMLEEEKEGKGCFKIHGMAPTNQGTLLLAMKCHQMNEMMQDAPSITANTLCDGFIRQYAGKNIPHTIRDLCLRFYFRNESKKAHKTMKVLYFASKTYSKILQNKNALRKQKKSNAKHDGMTPYEKVCVNLAAEYHLQRLPQYKTMSDKEKALWTSQYIVSELQSADMICTTFGNSCHRQIVELFEDDFTHAIADECNQSSLDTLLGIIGYPNLKHLTMAGDIRQLSPVAMSQNELCHSSIYEQIICYLTDDTFEPNEYYTRLNEQYRSHPQIYAITSNIFYDGTVKDNIHMEHKRAYSSNKRNYSLLFANHSNHIQFHMLTNSQKQLDSQRHSKYNESEARIAVKYIKKFIIDLEYREEEIAVISDYSAQIDCVYARLRRIKKINADKILLCTTNEIEGSSRPIVIYMCCRSNNTGNIGFLNDITRINVATSRAQYGQIIIGDIYTLQYNPIYRRIFNFHQKHGAVVYGKNICNLTIVDERIPLANVSLKHFLKQTQAKTHGKQLRLDYYVCGGCNRNIYCKLFCGRIICAPPMFIYICSKCIDRYLTQLCDSYIKNKFPSKFNAISSMTIIQKSDLNTSDCFGISLEFESLLSRHLVKFGLTKFSNLDLDETQKNKMSGLYLKFIEIAKEIVSVCSAKNKTQHIPHCFKVLSEFDVTTSKKEEIRSDAQRNKAIGIMQCIRNHLLRQSIIDARFFRLVYEIKNCATTLQRFYKRNKYVFYKFVAFEIHQPTFVVIAYLKACGYSTNIANYLHRRIGKLLFDKNLNKSSRNTPPIRLDDEEIISLAQYLKLDSLTGINNVLLSSDADSNGLSGEYAIKLVQNAVIDDPMSSYYDLRTHKTAIAKEVSFGDDLRRAGFDYYSEEELKDLGYKDTPDYYLKKPWVVYYNDCKYEITWIDFKYSYCSATQWNIDKLRFQATRYNKTFGPGAFVFSLGCVKIPKQLQMNSHGLIAALPLTKDAILKFIRLQIAIANKQGGALEREV